MQFEYSLAAPQFEIGTSPFLFAKAVSLENDTAPIAPIEITEAMTSDVSADFNIEFPFAMMTSFSQS